MRFLVLFLSLILPSIAQARIGDTAIQFADRYGSPKETPSTKTADRMWPLIEDGIHRTYEYRGWKIRAAFLELDGPCLRMDYQKILTAGTKPQIQDYELQAITLANTPAGMNWKKVMFHNPAAPDKIFNKAVEAFFGDAFGQEMWQRSDGAILWLRSSLIVRLELPAAREHEAQMKAANEQKARASVPQF
jgi:hypothetical protein